MTTLANFRNHLKDDLLQRGRHYYEGGHILQLKQFDRNFWLASVEGREIFQVAVTIGDDRQLEWQCSCKQDGLCEHVTAVLLALEAQLGSKPVKKDVKAAKVTSNQAQKLYKVVAHLSREEVNEFLVKQALKDKKLRQAVMARGQKERKWGQKMKGQVRDILRQAQGSDQWLDHRAATEAADEIFLLLDQGQVYLETGRTTRALRIFKAVIEEVVPVMDHTDDASGALSDCVQSGLDGLMMCADELDRDNRGLLFDYCLQKATDEVFKDWDWCWDLAGIAAALVETDKQRQHIFTVLDQMAKQRDGEEWAAEYDWERASLIKIALYQQEGNYEAVHEFLQKHRHKERMQFLLALLYIEQGDFDRAREICEGWLANPEPKIPELKAEFLAVLLEIAEIEGDIEEQKTLLNELFLHTGDLEYFDMLEELVDPEEWPKFRAQMLQGLQGREIPWVDVGSFFVQEEMWPELASLVLAFPKSAPRYHQYLAGEHPQDLSQAYERLAEDTLRRKANREGYRQVCGYLQKMQELGDQKRVEALVAGWREEYKQRRALLEELDRTFGSAS